MKSKDLVKENMMQMAQAIREDDQEGFVKAINDYAQTIEKRVLDEVNGRIAQYDDQVMLARKGNALTSEETEFYNKLVENARMNPQEPMAALSNVDVVTPPSIIDRILDDLKIDHPLLDAINFVNTSGMTEIYLNNDGMGAAAWGELTSAIVKELSSDFLKLNLKHAKLSAFVPIPNSMLDIGPQWLDRYVRTILTNSIAVGSETAIVSGDGKEKPIGMDRNISDGAAVVGGAYPAKDAIVIKEFTPATLGAVVTKINKTRKDNPRNIPEGDLILVVNTDDYWEKVRPATMLLTPNGTWVENVLPIPTRIIQTVALAKGEAVLGMASKYFYGIGIGTGKESKIDKSDQYRFLEDQTVYRIKLYGEGRAYDNNAFQKLDISNLKPLAPTVKTITGE